MSGAARTETQVLLRAKAVPQAVLRTKRAQLLAKSAPQGAASRQYRSHAQHAHWASLPTQKPALRAQNAPWARSRRQVEAHHAQIARGGILLSCRVCRSANCAWLGILRPQPRPVIASPASQADMLRSRLLLSASNVQQATSAMPRVRLSASSVQQANSRKKPRARLVPIVRSAGLLPL